MSKLREKMEADLRLKGFRPNTQSTYVSCVRRFAQHFGRSPDRLGETEVRAFLDFLACERHASPSTRRVYLLSPEEFIRHFLLHVLPAYVEVGVELQIAGPGVEHGREPMDGKVFVVTSP